MTESPFDLSQQHTDGRIIAALEKISQAFRVLLWNEGKELSLSPIQIQILIFLRFHPREHRKVSYLAVEFNVTKATISDAIKILIEKKLVRKEYEKEDARSYVLHLTRKGIQHADKTSHFTRQLQLPVEELSASEKETLLKSLLSIIRHLNTAGIVTTQRMCFTCSFYQPNHEGHQHYCTLLNSRLESSELRIDCPDHEKNQHS